jgi:hypothetical protein
MKSVGFDQNGAEPDAIIRVDIQHLNRSGSALRLAE